MFRHFSINKNRDNTKEIKVNPEIRFHSIYKVLFCLFIRFVQSHCSSCVCFSMTSKFFVAMEPHTWFQTGFIHLNVNQTKYNARVTDCSLTSPNCLKKKRKKKVYYLL